MRSMTASSLCGFALLAIAAGPSPAAEAADISVTTSYGIVLHREQGNVSLNGVVAVPLEIDAEGKCVWNFTPWAACRPIRLAVQAATSLVRPAPSTDLACRSRDR